MGTFRDQQPQVLCGAIKIVNTANLLMQPLDAVQRKNGVLVTVANEQGGRGDEGGHLWIIPSLSIHAEHAIAVPFDRAIDDMILEIGDPGDWTGSLDAFIQGGNPPGVGAPAAA